MASARRVGARSEHVAVRASEGVVAIADVRVRGVPLLGGGVAYVNGGPLTREGKADDLERFAIALTALRREFVERRRMLLRIVAPLGDSGWNDALRNVFGRLGFAESSAPGAYRTLVLDLRQPLEEIRARFTQKWRNCLNGAERQGLEVRSGDQVEIFEDFCRLYRTFRERKSFEVDLDADFFLAVQRDHLAAERFTVSLAHHGGSIVAGHVSSHLGDTSVYLLGATGELGRTTRAAYLLQWHAILEAKRRGALAYDLGGIDPESNPGVYHFKKGMCGVEMHAAGPYEASPGGVRAVAPILAERAYRRLRALWPR